MKDKDLTIADLPGGKGARPSRPSPPLIFLATFIYLNVKSIVSPSCENSSIL